MCELVDKLKRKQIVRILKEKWGCENEIELAKISEES